MADIRLVKPQANTAQTVSCAADSRFVLEFPSDAALFARDGDDLVLTFEDGSSIRLQDFYTTYSKEEMPSFEMEGAEISGEDFFAALGNPDLMPAAGPTAAAAQGNSSFNVYGDAALLGGIDRLDGLDISFNFGQQTQDDLYASIGRDDDEGVVDHGVTVKPSEPGTLDPEIPVIDNPVNPGGNTRPGAGNSILFVSEADLGGDSYPTATDSMQIDAPDGVGSIVIDGVTVFTNGRPVLDEDGDPVKVSTDEGYLTATYDPSTGVLKYIYTLTAPTTEHKEPGADKIAHSMDVIVTDRDGDSASSTISIVIEDDIPVLTLTPGQDATYGEDTIIGTLDLNYGGDGAAASDSLVLSINNVPGILSDGTYTFAGIGTATIDEQGNIHFTPAQLSGGDKTYTLTATITDADGDEATESFDFKVEQTKVDFTDVTLTTRDDGTTGEDSSEDRFEVQLPEGQTLVAGTYIVTNGKDGEPIGTLTVAENGAISFTQDEAYTAGEQGDNQAKTEEVFTTSVTVQLADGTMAPLSQKPLR